MKLKSLFAIGIASLLMASCSGPSNQGTENKERIEKVKSSLVAKQVMTRNIDLTASLQGYDRMSVAPSVTGNIEHIYVREGDRVKKGDTLVRMNQNQLNNTRLTFANLSIEMNRVEELRKSEAISQQVYDQTKLSYDQTEESLRFLEQNTIVTAPFDGVISARNYEDGELYSGQPILELTKIKELKSLVNVPESFFPKVKKGMKVVLKSPIYPDKEFPAVVETVFPTVDAASHTFTVRIKVNNTTEELRPGMYANATLDMGSEEILVVPYQSVIRLIGSNERYVYVNDNKVAKRVFVKLGDRFDEYVEILPGTLKEGDEIITSGQERLVDGVKLNIVK